MDERLHITIAGAVQGVGFRPFVYRLATALHVTGWVNNCPQGVAIEAEASHEQLAAFLDGIRHQAPPHATIHRLETRRLPPLGYAGFEIRQSADEGARTAVILPDLALCPDCLAELFDPANRRYRYPFINCTHCGPRFSIIIALPYDRPNTTMQHFVMCQACRSEYENPLDRRFHAQPTACPVCGPQLALWDADGTILSERHEALLAAADALRHGHIVALKGLGGFQLLADARSSAAVARLRTRKQRPAKPFAVMYPDSELLRADCAVSDDELGLLTSAAAPIMLLRRRDGASVAAEAAPGNPHLGAMLPYTPLHHLLLHELGFPVIATSGNRSGEPICTDEDEALERLHGIADLFLVHNRPVARPVDDSVARVMAGGVVLLRRARGYAPLPVQLDDWEPAHTMSPPLLAVGAQQKNVIALADGQRVILSQHIGDLDTPQADAAFRRAISDMQALCDARPAAVVHDLHPDYRSTQYAQESGLPAARVQHHLAHVLACMAEHGLRPPVLGVSWDGTGYGTDGAVWGGEFLRVDQNSWARAAHLQPFYLPGGGAAIREPRRAALGLLYALFGDSPPDTASIRAFRLHELRLLRAALRQGVNAPLTSSAGRLFDAVASLLDIQHQTSFEGQAAMALEFCAADVPPAGIYPFSIMPDGVIALAPLVRALLDDRAAGVDVGVIAARFHHTLAEMIVEIARRARIEQVALSGGCFQNRLLLESAAASLKQAGFRPFWSQAVPLNDGGIALGQVFAVWKGYAHVSGSAGKNPEY